jgi:folate-binding protein YgfZ
MSITPDNEGPIATPLAEVHRSTGASIGLWFGCALPSDWGDVKEEQRFANESVALIDKNYKTYFTFKGPDRVRYLNAILTNNIKELREGQGVLSLLLSAQGRILAEMEIFASADQLLGVSYQMIRERLTKVIEKYIIMDDVTLTDDSDVFGALGLEGPKAGRVLQDLAGFDLASLPELGFAEVRVDAKGVLQQPIPGRVVKSTIADIPSAEFIVERKYLEALWKILSQAVRFHDGGPMGYAALSAQRLVQGKAWFGYEFGEKQIPHEAALETSHISYTKGCYTGQEIVERVRSRGQVNRRRVLLEFAGESVPEVDEALTVDGKPVGHVTRSAQSYYPRGIFGMGYVNKENRAVGTTLAWREGNAQIVENVQIPKGNRT